MKLWHRVRATRDDGQIMLLSIVYGVVVLALVLVIASVSYVYLERKRLWSLADALAADAADAADTQVWYETAAADGLVVTQASATESINDYLAAAPANLPGSFDDLAVSRVQIDGQEVTVSMAATVRPPFIPWGLVPGTDGFTVVVTSSAIADDP